MCRNSRKAEALPYETIAFDCVGQPFRVASFKNLLKPVLMQSSHGSEVLPAQ